MLKNFGLVVGLLAWSANCCWARATTTKDLIEECRQADLLDPDKAPQTSTMVEGTLGLECLSYFAIGDLYRLYVEARNQKLDFNYGAIPPDFVMASKEPFDVAYMNALFEYGYQLGRNGYKWKKAPPGLDAKRTGPLNGQDRPMQQSAR